MRKLRTLLIIPLLTLAIASTACGPVYGKLAKGLFAISVGLDKVQTFNETSFKSGDISRDAATKINNDIIKAEGIKKRANTLMGSINPDAPTPSDIDSVFSLLDELSPVVDDMNQAGQLGIKSQASKNKFSLIITGITGGVQIVKAVRR